MRKIALLTSIAAASAFAVPFANDRVAPPAAAAKSPRAKAEAPQITELVSDMPIPTITRGAVGSRSPFPFDTMEVGQSFGVSNKTAKQMSSIVSNQNRKASNYRNKVDAEGKEILTPATPITDANGNVVGQKPGEPIKEQIKVWVVSEVDHKKDPAKARVRIWRKQ